MLQRRFYAACIFYFNFGIGFIFKILGEKKIIIVLLVISLHLQFSFFPLDIVGKSCVRLTLDQFFLQSFRVRRLNPSFHASPLHNQGQPLRKEHNYLVWQAGQMAG